LSKGELPLISIITPSLNQRAYIKHNIKSVLDQNYPNFEHIIIDGSSTDGTIDILKKYKHLIWISEKDGGQSEAINKGFKKARGEIIGWLNSDDCYEPGAFFTVVAELNKVYGKYIVSGDCSVIDDRGNKVGYCKGRFSDHKDLIKYWDRDYTIPQPSVFFYRDILQECGYLDEKLHYGMDYEFWLRISKHRQIYYIEKPLAKIRVHDHAKSSPGYEVFECEWFRVSKEYWGGLFSINYYRLLFLALSFRSHLMRLSAYSRMEELSLKEFRRRILLSITSNPLNLFRRRFLSALLRSILGHHNTNSIKRLLN